MDCFNLIFYNNIEVKCYIYVHCNRRFYREESDNVESHFIIKEFFMDLLSH